jgi:C1A family cysteine protease
MEENKTKYKFTYKFQKKDHRDYTIQLIDNNIVLKTSKDIKLQNTIKLAPRFIIPYLAPILDQGNIGSCVCNSASLIISTKTKNKVNISRLFLYAICRIYDDTSLDQDAGTTVRTCCNMLKKYGACLENIYNYNTNNFSNFPPLNTFKNCNLFKNFTYYSVKQDLNTLKQTLVTFKQPITFAIMVYDSFMSDSVSQNGIVPMPDTTTEQLLGGHCVTMIGYNDYNSWFICANSWGKNWGNKGLFYLPYNYVLDTNLTSDFYRYTFNY